MNREELKAKMEAMRASLRGGVQAVSAPQLFPTPDQVVSRMIYLARLEPGMSVLEPSAGTGAILKALPADVSIVAVEINAALVSRLNGYGAVCADFLECIPDEMGAFDRVLMNPPFTKGSDIKHVLHARRFLRPGGVLVGICADGPRQGEALGPMADTWERLPSGTFNGTGVSAALFTITNNA